MSLSGKCVLVTGASRGLGAATAEAFLGVGARVVATGRNTPVIAEERSRLQALGDCSFRNLDVTDEEAVVELFASLEQVDVLINNAGIARVRPFLDSTVGELREILETNLIGAFVVMREAARRMVAQGGGEIVNIASDAALGGIPKMSGYVASKHALLGLSRSARQELHEHGVRVTTVCPGPIDTEILGGSDARFIATGDLADTLVQLASLPGSMTIQEMLVQPTGIAGKYI